jgi:hypothetical protein
MRRRSGNVEHKDAVQEDDEAREGQRNNVIQPPRKRQRRRRRNAHINDIKEICSCCGTEVNYHTFQRNHYPKWDADSALWTTTTNEQPNTPRIGRGGTDIYRKFQERLEIERNDWQQYTVRERMVLDRREEVQEAYDEYMAQRYEEDAAMFEVDDIGIDTDADDDDLGADEVDNGEIEAQKEPDAVQQNKGPTWKRFWRVDTTETRPEQPREDDAGDVDRRDKKAREAPWSIWLLLRVWAQVFRIPTLAFDTLLAILFVFDRQPAWPPTHPSTPGDKKANNTPATQARVDGLFGLPGPASNRKQEPFETMITCACGAVHRWKDCYEEKNTGAHERRQFVPRTCGRITKKGGKRHACTRDLCVIAHDRRGRTQPRRLPGAREFPVWSIESQILALLSRSDLQYALGIYSNSPESRIDESAGAQSDVWDGTVWEKFQ